MPCDIHTEKKLLIVLHSLSSSSYKDNAYFTGKKEGKREVNIR